MNTIDLRSDTVTRPTPAMRAAMAEAEVGDDVYGEDPTVNRLQEMAAERIGTEAALFTPSGTQCNLIAIMSHCERGDEYLVGQTGHTFRYEGGGAAVLGSVQPQPLDFEPDGSIDLERAARMIKPIDPHFARTRLLCLENTQAGKVLPLSYLEDAARFAHEHGLGLHLDGARVFNAAVALGVPVREITGHFDSVAFCLSKGLGAPVGSVLCGNAQFIERAHRWRKVTGGGLRQAGILAAAGIHALEHHVERLAEDHANAHRLAEGLGQIGALGVDPEAVQTNMVFAHVDREVAGQLAAFLKARDILVTPNNPMRLVTHLDVGARDIDHVLDAVREFFASESQERGVR